tara:strand:+ start:1818 stop:4568 length:2751 start_codon:yes stop_codon:yes gene_type:complete
MSLKTLAIAIDARGARHGAVAFRKATNSIATSASGAGKASKAMGASMAHTAGAIKSMVLPLVGLVGILKTVTTISKFEEAMATLGSVTGEVDMITRETTASFEQMEKTARLLGSTTRFSASEASAGMLELARAGFSANETMDAIAHTLDLATSAGIGLGEASGYVANSIRQFGLEASEAVRVADAFVLVSNKSNTTVSELAEAMKMVGTVSASVGASLEETASVIGILGDRGVKATMAGTQLRGVLIALAKPTDKAKKAMDKLGLSAQELDPAQNSLHDIAVKLDGAFRKLGNRYEALGLSSEIFGRRNASGALAMASSADKLRDLTREAELSEEAHTDMANVMDDTVVGAFFGLKSAIEEAMLVMGDAGALGGMRSIIDVSAEMVRIFADVEGAWESAGAMAKIMATALKMVVARFLLVKTLGMIPWLLGFTGATAGATVATLGLGGAIKKVGMAIASNPIGIALTAIAGGYILLSDAIQRNENAQNRMEKASKDVAEIVMAENEAVRELAENRERILQADGSLHNPEMEKALEGRVVMLDSYKATLEEHIKLTKELAETYGDKWIDNGVLADLEQKSARVSEEKKKLSQVIKDLGYNFGDLESEIRGYDQALTSSNKAREDFMYGVKAETELLNIRGKSIEHTVALIEAMEEAQKKGFETEGERFDLLVDEIMARNEAKKSLDEYLKSQDDIANPEVLSNMEKMIQQLVNMGMGLDEAKEKAMQVKLSGEAMNETFATTFGDIIRGTESAKDALKNFFQFLLDEIMKLTVLNPMKELFGDMWGDFAKGLGGGDAGGGDYNFMSDQSGNDWMPNAHGNAYDRNGRITAFASGGVVSSPTLFNYGGGRGLMGEAGAEAIMPLKRDSKGNLGISSEGGQGKVVNVTMNVVTKDADSFRRSRSQIQSDMRQASNMANK